MKPVIEKFVEYQDLKGASSSSFIPLGDGYDNFRRVILSVRVFGITVYRKVVFATVLHE